MDSTSYILKKIPEYKLLDSDEQLELVKKAQKGDKKSREKLIKHNLRLVLSIAKKYDSVELADLIQAGVIGLDKAIDKFDVNKENRFSTYAYYWIFQTIGREVAKHSRIIRLPTHMFQLISKIEKVKEELESQEIKPTPEIIAEKLGENVSKIKTAMEVKDEPLSLEYENEEEDNFKGFLEQQIFENPEEKLLKDEYEKERREVIQEALNTLKPMYKEVLILRFGLDGFGKKRTLKEVSELVGITKERVRQIEKTSLDILRSSGGRSNRRKRIREYA